MKVKIIIDETMVLEKELKGDFKALKILSESELFTFKSKVYEATDEDDIIESDK